MTQLNRSLVMYDDIARMNDDMYRPWLVGRRAGQDSTGHTLYFGRCAKCGTESPPSRMRDLTTRARKCRVCNPVVTRAYRKEHQAWRDMLNRCLNSNCKKYPDYGGRGIKVCDAWRGSFRAFFLDVGAAPAPKMSLDRIDNNGNYEPGNVRWTTVAVQNGNRRTPTPF